MSVVVFGAAGHTGRFVVNELLARGIVPVAVGRNARALAVAGFEERGVPMRVAEIGDADSLHRAVRGARVLINCAGPFLDTAVPLIELALHERLHYIDVTAEQMSALSTFLTFDGAARERGMVLIPAAGFYGGLGDVLATACAGDWAVVDEITVAIALDSWHPTEGTRKTGSRNTAPRLILADGVLQPQTLPRAETTWTFPEPFGIQKVVELPLSETITLAQHFPGSTVRNYINATPLRDLNDASTPPPQAVDRYGRSAQIFIMEAVAQAGERVRRARVRGQDIYAITAPLVVEAAQQILAGSFKGSGARALGEVFDAGAFLKRLAQEHLRLEIIAA